MVIYLFCHIQPSSPYSFFECLNINYVSLILMNIAYIKYHTLSGRPSWLNYRYSSMIMDFSTHYILVYEKTSMIYGRVTLHEFPSTIVIHDSSMLCHGEQFVQSMQNVLCVSPPIKWSFFVFHYRFCSDWMNWICYME